MLDSVPLGMPDSVVLDVLDVLDVLAIGLKHPET